VPVVLFKCLQDNQLKEELAKVVFVLEKWKEIVLLVMVLLYCLKKDYLMNQIKLMH